MSDGWPPGTKPRPTPRPLPCAYCKERFASAASLASHERARHGSRIDDPEFERLRALIARELKDNWKP